MADTQSPQSYSPQMQPQSLNYPNVGNSSLQQEEPQISTASQQPQPQPQQHQQSTEIQNHGSQGE